MVLRTDVTLLQIQSTCPHLFVMALCYHITLHVCANLKRKKSLNLKTRILNFVDEKISCLKNLENVYRLIYLASYQSDYY